ncbi:methyltransferase type 12 [Anopheles sinensis]|uniref:Methyltransferase type 12 n=1 Tax=Anopheles sinensis TaxID=74873 RepID=A0A084VPH4_ANOSI|nr:methyltransferase type 12 [Anopheles sinensis]
MRIGTKNACHTGNYCVRSRCLLGWSRVGASDVVELEFTCAEVDDARWITSIGKDRKIVARKWGKSNPPRGMRQKPREKESRPTDRQWRLGPSRGEPNGNGKIVQAGSCENF